MEPDESPDIAAEKGFFQRSVAPVSHPPQSSSASRFTAAQAGFFILSQWGERPERWVESLRFDTIAFEAELTGKGEDGRAVAFDILVESNAGAGLGHHGNEPRLADLKRITPQVVTIQLDQVEGVEEDAVVSAVVPDETERGAAVKRPCGAP
jgi:hypothetical protein